MSDLDKLDEEYVLSKTVKDNPRLAIRTIAQIAYKAGALAERKRIEEV